MGWINKNIHKGNQLSPQLNGQIIFALMSDEYDVVPGRQPRGAGLTGELTGAARATSSRSASS